ncbi:hypothetical protein ACO22_06640 [Paracoccidioides brasiliensis]|uniref:Uncharacterized protein n=1 Tax=Paracoccidioides brasiliensis TaxID=121759 RepID=A0A1D2J6W9_PARBR|nr:hypothetical protein ACO22_06640 [Paracoccidioides brasiliensis]
MNELASLNMEMVSSVSSSGRDSRPNMFSCSHPLSSPGASSKFFSTIGLTMCSGEIELTRIPFGPHSIARLLASWISAAFEALYADKIKPRFADRTPQVQCNQGKQQVSASSTKFEFRGEHIVVTNPSAPASVIASAMHNPSPRRPR